MREGAEFREIAVVEHEEEGAGAGAEALDRMAVAAREVPDIARAEVDDLALADRIDGGDPAIALEHIGPFGGIGVPVQLAQGARLERHVDPGELLRHREAGDVRLLGGAAVELLGLLRAKRKAERGKLWAVERGRRRTVRRLPRLTAERGGVPQKTAHRHTSSNHTAPGYLDHGKVPKQKRLDIRPDFASGLLRKALIGGGPSLGELEAAMAGSICVSAAQGLRLVCSMPRTARHKARGIWQRRHRG